MACDSPITAYRGADGAPVFNKYHSPTKVEMKLPCGKCAGCRLERSRQWAMRCMHELREHDKSCFLTLTYDNGHLPSDGGLIREHPQLFLKRLRHFYGSGVKFYGCGEYGDTTNRPHYHLIMFGMCFEDKVFYKNTPRGDKLYSSKIGDLLWKEGQVIVGDVTFESCAYVARYCMKKVNGAGAEAHYMGRLPEFSMMSKGIGAKYFEKYGSAAYERDKIVINGVECKPPRYYDKKFAAIDEAAFSKVKQQRKRSALAHRADSTPERLHVRAVVRAAKMGKRSL